MNTATIRITINPRALYERAIVRWCQLAGEHQIEPWIGSGHFAGPTVLNAGPGSPWMFSRIVSEHSGCEACTWCQDCGRLLGREEVPE